MKYIDFCIYVYIYIYIYIQPIKIYRKLLGMVRNMLWYPTYVLQAGAFLADLLFGFTCPFQKTCIFAIFDFVCLYCEKQKL